VIKTVTITVAALTLGVIGLSVSVLPDAKPVATPAPAARAIPLRAAQAASCVFTRGSIQRIGEAAAPARTPVTSLVGPFAFLQRVMCAAASGRAQRAQTKPVLVLPVGPVEEGRLFAI
jgi:hypothetical protein